MKTYNLLKIYRGQTRLLLFNFPKWVIYLNGTQGDLIL
jgi:hypothetical protein